MNKIENIEAFIVVTNAVCTNCQYGRHNYKNAPDECRQCGFNYQRNTPCAGLIPIWKDGYCPTEQERDLANKHVIEILNDMRDVRPANWPKTYNGYPIRKSS